MAAKNRKGRRTGKAGEEVKTRTADIETASEYVTINDLKKWPKSTRKTERYNQKGIFQRAFLGAPRIRCAFSFYHYLVCLRLIGYS